jgi:creatinine amidohydrolase/Fe(II)-dependent formamide hydrolase-like protein
MAGPTSKTDVEPARAPFLSRMSSPQIAALVELGDVDVLIPLGALEQHGPHLPLGTDTVIAEAIAAGVARAVGALVVAPCLPVGCSEHHLSFPGTASVPEAVVAGYIRSTALTVLSHGFRYVYVVSGHAGNIPAMSAAVASLPPEVEGRVAAFVDWPAQRRALHEWAESSQGLSGAEVGSHSGHFETSIMLQLDPSSVDMSAAPKGFIGRAEEASELMRAKGMAAVSEIGVVGDARSASSEAGASYLEILTGTVVEFIEQHRSHAAQI